MGKRGPKPLSREVLLLRGSPLAKHRVDQDEETEWEYIPPQSMPVTKGTTMDGLLTIDEVAQLLKVSKATVRNMRRDRRIPPPVELSSNNIRWSATVMNDWILAGCPSPIAVTQNQKGDTSNE